MPCPFTPQAGQGNCLVLQATSKSILRLAVSSSTLTFPRRLQSQRGRKQGFNTNTHCGFLKLKQWALLWTGASPNVSAWSSPRHAMSTAMAQRIGPAQHQGFASPGSASRRPPLTLLLAWLHRRTRQCKVTMNYAFTAVTDMVAEVNFHSKRHWARFGSSAELESTLRNYLKIYNHSIPQRALKHQTPIQALKMWQEKKPDLFVKRVYNHTGLNI